jgi:TMEM175 potassium channel family protein
MPTNRMEAFSDGVIAILITVMVLELHVPHGTSWESLRESLPTLLTYVLSFVYLGIYWNNHHHMLMVTEEVDGLVLWANLHLLFWLSLIPFATGWMGENHFAPVPTAAYGIVLLAAALAYYILQTAIIHRQGAGSTLALALGRDLKGKLSPGVCVTGIVVAFVDRWLAVTVYVLLALMWLVPDRRVERTIIARRAAEATAPPPTSERG